MTKESQGLRDIYGWAPSALSGLDPLAGEPAYRARQIARWLYQNDAERFEQMTDLPIPLRTKLAAECAIGRPRIERTTEASDGSALKCLLILDDGRPIETVWIRDRYRNTVCVSSQAGCAYGCAFCATASMGAGRNLRPGEILGQITLLRALAARDGAGDLHNIVFMGMGEPLANPEGLLPALELICSEWGLAFSPRRITISTVGLEPGIRRLAEQPYPVRLAFSLNATTDEARSRLMPVNRKHPIRTVLEALRDYRDRLGARITIEYLLLKGINDSAEDARRLARYARSLQCRVNLIAYNPHPNAPFEPADDGAIARFRESMLPIADRVTVTVRWSKGREIQAACGQLAAI